MSQTMTNMAHREEQCRTSGGRIDRTADYDVISSLPDPRRIFDLIDQRMLRAKREQSMFTLFSINLDRFKEADDRLGHHFSALLLKELAQRLRSCLRKPDTVERLGEHELAVLVSTLKSRTDAATVAQRLVDAIALPFFIEGREYPLGARIGISLYPDDGETAELLLVKADTAMCRARRIWYNNYQFYSS